MTIAPTKLAAARLTALVCSLGLGISAAAQTQPSVPAGGLSAEWMAAAQGWVEQAVAAAQSAQQAGPRYQAALQSYAQVQKLSLFNFIN